MNTRPLLFSTFLLFAIGLSKINAQTVFVTSTGKKYHTKNCDLLKEGKKKSITLAEARKQGYDACKMCKADEIVATDEKKKQVPVK